MLPLLASILFTHRQGPENGMEFLRRVAREVIASSAVPAGSEIPGIGKNTTGHTLRVPGGTQNFYPAFWIRDASMMLGSDFVPEEELEGWIRVVASVQPGPAGLRFAHGLRVPSFGIPDHVTLAGEACWYPGAYTEQGVGDYGILPPADDAFFFIQMVAEQYRLARSTAFLARKVTTGWGDRPVLSVAEKAFDSVDADPITGLVVCDAKETRVDWGFCDSIRKTGSCLMPSLLRWQAANRLAALARATGHSQEAETYRSTATRIRHGILTILYRPQGTAKGTLYSATGLGHQDDIWASAFAIWLGILPTEIERAVALHLDALYKAGLITAAGQARELARGEFWQQASSAADSYQNGGYWATPTGWLIVALSKVDRAAANELFTQFVTYLRANRAAGAPFEWVNPAAGVASNPNYGSSAGLVYISLEQARFNPS